MRVKLEYMITSLSLEQLAEKHNVKAKTLRTRVDREKWHVERRDYVVKMTGDYLTGYVEKLVEIQIKEKQTMLVHLKKMQADIYYLFKYEMDKPVKKRSIYNVTNLVRSYNIVKNDIFDCLNIPPGGRQNLPTGADVAPPVEKTIQDMVTSMTRDEMIIFARRTIFNIEPKGDVPVAITSDPASG